MMPHIYLHRNVKAGHIFRSFRLTVAVNNPIIVNLAYKI
jgi:hypothetical protein